MTDFITKAEAETRQEAETWLHTIKKQVQNSTDVIYVSPLLFQLLKDAAQLTKQTVDSASNTVVIDIEGIYLPKEEIFGQYLFTVKHD